MFACVFLLAIPILPIFLRKLYKSGEKLSGRDLLLRYLANLLLVVVITALFLFLCCEEGESFLEKADRSPEFTLKLILGELAAALAAAGFDWWYETRWLKVTVDEESFRNHILFRLGRRLISLGIYILAAVVFLMNLSLIFDNVLWGDEAYSANLVRYPVPDMLQIISLEEPHPPLYYLWLKMWVELLGWNGPVFHFASLLLAALGLILTVVLVKKRCGAIPAAFPVVFMGMSQMCLTYNVEIRMYAMAFLAVTFCYYCCGRVLENNRLAGWTGMVFWGLVAAYAHYFALLSVVIMMIVTCLLAVWRFGKKTWISTFTAGILFIAGYLPWLRYMTAAVNRVKGDWWLEESVPLTQVVDMIFGGAGMRKWMLPLTVLILFIVLAAESGILERKKADGKIWIRLQAPKAVSWSSASCVLTAGAATILLTVAAAYLADVVYRPILSQRYVYPLGGVAVMMVAVGGGRILELLKRIPFRNGLLEKAGKGVLLVGLAVLILTGLKDYKAVRGEVKQQSAMTEASLALIGEPAENMVFATNNVKHLAWTVLSYYYPEAEVMVSRCDQVEADDFWYLNYDFITESDVEEMYRKGYEIAGYGQHQIATYPFVLYHFYRTAPGN